MTTLERITKLISEHGWNKSEFLRRVGLPVTTYTDWNAGRHKSYEKHLDKIAEVLHTTPEYLRGETDDPSLNGKDQNIELPEEFYIMARKAQQLTDAQRKRLFKTLDGTIDMVIEQLKDEGDERI